MSGLMSSTKPRNSKAHKFDRLWKRLLFLHRTYTSDTGKSYDFNTATKLNSLLVKVLKNTGQLMAGESYDLDFDHQFIEMEKYDAKMTYKKFFASEANKFELQRCNAATPSLRQKHLKAAQKCDLMLIIGKLFVSSHRKT